MVLPLLSRSAASGRRCATDQTLEGHPKARASTSDELRARRCFLPETSTASPAALGVRQPQALTSGSGNASRSGTRPRHNTGPATKIPAAPAAGICRTASMTALFQDHLRKRVDIGLQ